MNFLFSEEQRKTEVVPVPVHKSVRVLQACLLVAKEEDPSLEVEEENP
jgi:hypothetical protein